jgi:UDP-GlcNAc:undecaprenyl-phosphate GlcNAc-1-phosphate transferase
VLLKSVFGADQPFFADFNTLVDHLGPAVGPLIVAAVVAAALTPAAIVLSRRFGMMAVPDGVRHRHLRPTPLLGGAVLAAAFTVGVVVFHKLDLLVLSLIFIGVLTAVLFMADDRDALNPLAKFGLQLLVSLVAVILFGDVFRITYFFVPYVGQVQIGLFAVPLTLLWLLGMQNTVNLLDGVDGLAAGVVAIVALVLAVAAAGRGQPDVVLFSGALAGACLGFLLFNFYPARVFMGDSGAHFLGLTLGLLSVVGVAKVAVAFALVVPVLALAIPIVDTGWAIVRRRRRKVSIAHPDTRHIHHQLLDFGLTPLETCLLFYCGTGILGALALMLFGHRRILLAAVVLFSVAIFTVVGARLQGVRARWSVPGAGRLLSKRTAPSR